MKTLYIATCDDELTTGYDLKDLLQRVSELYGIPFEDDDHIQDAVGAVEEQWEEGQAYSWFATVNPSIVRIYKITV